jgi:hypothetical protein
LNIRVKSERISTVYVSMEVKLTVSSEATSEDGNKKKAGI